MVEQSWLGQLGRFFGVGGIATVVQLALFALFLLFMDQTWANIVSWTISTLGANVLQRRIAFHVDGVGARRDLIVSSGFSVLALVVSMVVLAWADVDAAIPAILLLLTVNLVVGVVRFVAVRRWYIAEAA